MSGGSSGTRILAVDDHPLVRQGIAGVVDAQADMTVVAEAANGRDAINQFRTHRPDVTLMDIQLPGMNGLDALIAIRTEFPDAKAMVLTTYEGDVHILRTLKAVLRATCLRTRSHSDLLQTIRAEHADRRGLSPEVSFQVAQHVSRVPLNPPGMALTTWAIASGSIKSWTCAPNGIKRSDTISPTQPSFVRECSWLSQGESQTVGGRQPVDAQARKR